MQQKTTREGGFLWGGVLCSKNGFVNMFFLDIPSVLLKGIDIICGYATMKESLHDATSNLAGVLIMMK
jgi:hypothetical protein